MNIFHKIFSVINKNGHKIFTIFGLKIKFKLKNRFYNANQLSQNDIINYLEQYKYILKDISHNNSDDRYKNCIWMCWLQGYDYAPQIVKSCISSVKKYSGGRKVIIIDKNNYKNFVDLPDYIIEKHEKGIISNTHFSDILRINLLNKFGGTWIDASCLLTSEIPKEILNSDLFVFQGGVWLTTQHSISPVLFEYLAKHPNSGHPANAISSWFIHSTPSNPVNTAVKNILNAYWANEDKLIDYFLFHYIFTFVIVNNEECMKIFEQMPIKSNTNPHYMQWGMFDTYNENYFNELQKYSFIHK